jgi:hypothetical protein
MYVTLPPRFGAAALRKQRAARRRAKAVATGDPVQDLRNEAAELGYNGDPNNLADMAYFCWTMSPTDGMAELMNELIDLGVIAAEALGGEWD